MERDDITMQDAFDDLRKDFESGIPLCIPAYKVSEFCPSGRENEKVS